MDRSELRDLWTVQKCRDPRTDKKYKDQRTDQKYSDPRIRQKYRDPRTAQNIGIHGPARIKGPTDCSVHRDPWSYQK